MNTVKSKLRGRLERHAPSAAGTTLNLGAAYGINLRVAPRRALESALKVDLDILGPWLTAIKGNVPVQFLQIGAFDGITNDPMHDLVERFGWRGILVEPQPGPFERLRHTYAGYGNLELVNAAVSTQPGTMTLWRVADWQPSDPEWVEQSASFDRDHLIRHTHWRQDLIDRIVGLPVETVTLRDLFARSPAPVDVLQIDAEGYDARIVAMLDGIEHRPTIVRFEHRNLLPADHAEAVARLAGHGYRIGVNEDDTIAVLYEPGRGTTATY
jgi:FkbM family methyltransferase